MSSDRKINLTSYDEIFRTDFEREEANREKVAAIPLSDLHPFPGHPFKVLDDDRMKETAESVRTYGILVPAIVRPRMDGGYEIIAGHR